MIDGLVFLQYHNREHNIRTNMLIIFAVVNIVVKKMLIIGMICGMSIIVADFEKENNAIGGKEVCHDRKVRFTPK